MFKFTLYGKRKEKCQISIYVPNKLVNNNNMPRTKNAPKKRINEEVSNTKINNNNIIIQTQRRNNE